MFYMAYYIKIQLFVQGFHGILGILACPRFIFSKENLLKFYYLTNLWYK